MGKLHLIGGLLLIAALVISSGCIGAPATPAKSDEVVHINPEPTSEPIVLPPPFFPEPTVKGKVELATILTEYGKDNAAIGRDMPDFSGTMTEARAKKIESVAGLMIANDNDYMRKLDNLQVDPSLRDLKENGYQMISYHRKSSEHMKTAMSMYRSELYEMAIDELKDSKEDLDTMQEYEHRAITAVQAL